MNLNYVLNEDGEPVAEPDVIVWGKWLETAERIVEATNMGEVRVSTVFLGLDHQWGDGPPILWETMIFGGKHDGYQMRYMSRDAAIRGHRDAVILVGTT